MSTLPGSRAATPNSMASAAEDVEMDAAQFQPSQLGKRKRDSEDIDGDEDEDEDYAYQESESENEESLFIPDGRYIAPADIDEDESADEADDTAGSDDEEDGDADEPHQQAYSEASEAFPNCTMYDPDLPAVTESFLAIPRRVSEILAKHQCDGKHITSQRKAAEKVFDIPKSKKLRIGLLGDAGAGKSSLLNSLTDLDDLAKSLSGGQSCTCVPTEYQDAFDEQKKDFAASIRYFDIQKVTQVLEEMLSDYNTYNFEHDRTWDEDTRNMYKRCMQNAEKTFQVLFGDLKEFLDKSAMKAYLKQSYEQEDFTGTVEKMKESCEHKLEDKIKLGGQYAEFVEASTRSKLRELIDPLLGAKPKGSDTALWPLVKHVSIGVRGTRVLDKVTIVDLPGISDTNSVRVDMTKRYIKSCDALWVIAPIKRVVDDGSVYNLLSTYGKVFKNKVMVVCTHSDDGVDRKLANFLKEEGRDVDAYYEVSNESKAKKAEVTQAKARLKALRNRKKPTKQVLVDAQKAEDKVKRLKNEWLAIDQRRFDFLVQVRAHFVTEQLQEEMQYHLPTGSTLMVTCVSNSHYAALKGAAKISGARLDAVTTGIPELRAVTLALAAPGLLRTLEAYVKVQLTVFLKSAHMWVNTTPVERRQELLDLVRGPKKALPGRISKHREHFRKAVEDSVSFALSNNKQYILEVALKKFEEKKSKHHSTVRAFIRKNGKHSTRMCPKETWNEDFCRAVINIVLQESPAWEALFKNTLDVTKAWIITDIRRVLLDLGEQPSASILPMHKFRELIDTQVLGIENAFTHQADEYDKDLRAVWLDMTQDSLANYFSKTILPVYEACQKDSGNGVTARMMGRLEHHLKQQNGSCPFTIIEQKAVKALVKNDKIHMNARIKKSLDKIFQQTYAAFDRMIDKTVEDPKEAKARLDLKAHMDTIQAEYDAAKLKLETIKQRYA